MRFQFYTLVAGSEARPELHHHEQFDLEAAPAQARSAVEAAYRELVEYNPKVGNLTVISPTLSDPPGAMVATEFIHSNPILAQRRGQPARSLAWVWEWV